MMFAAPPDQSLEWSDAGVEGSNRFLKWVWRAVTAHLDAGKAPALDLASLSPDARDLRRKLHETIGKVENDLQERQTFNTAIAALMELSNAVIKSIASDGHDRGGGARMLGQSVADACPICAAFGTKSIANALTSTRCKASFPVQDSSALTKSSQTIVGQCKIRAKLDVSVDISDDLKTLAKAHPDVQRFLTAPTKKEVVVKGKLVNFVI